MQVLLNKDKSNLILNFENITYIDSSGFAALVSIYNYAKNNHVEFLICNIFENNMALAKITKLNNIFNIYLSLCESIAAISE